MAKKRRTSRAARNRRRGRTVPAADVAELNRALLGSPSSPAAGGREKPAALRTSAEGRITPYLDPELARWLRVSAAHRGVSASAEAARFIAEGLDLNPPPGYQPREAAAASTRTPAEARERAGELQRDGCTYERVAEVLNSEGYRTARGKPWNTVSVGRMMQG